MSYKEKPQIKLYKYENSSFILQAIIDDYQECSFEDNFYEAGRFSITINFNIPNSQLFQRGLFIQFGNSWKFGEITKIQDQIGEDGKGSQYRIITGYDARYILKRRVIKNMNSNGRWVMTGKGEIVLRNLVDDQAGTNAEEKRKLPIVNTIPSSENAVGKEYSASEQFSNLYEVCKTIATQSEMGWRLEFNGSSLNLVCFGGTDRTQTVQFSTSFDSLANGEFIDSSESFANAIYVGGKGQNDDRDIYEGESGIEGNSPSGLDRFESWDNQSSMTTESEYETEALSMLNQYGQTLTMSGNGLAKCPYEYEKEYFVGDKIKIAFSGKSANAQILSVTEHWAFGVYEINFSFGKPLPDLNAQLQLILKQIQKASNKNDSTDSIRWYTIPTDTEMPSADVTYSTIGFIGDAGSGATFKLYLDDEKTGAKTYHVWFKQLAGSGKLTLTTGKSGAVDLDFSTGTYVAIISVDENGNIVNVASTPTDVIQAGNNSPATSDAVYQAIQSSESTVVDVVENGNMNAITSNAVANHKPANADSANSANGLKIRGYGYHELTYYQTSDTFNGYNGWAHYIIANHGNGQSYYNFMLGLPFWGIPMYKRLENGTPKGWFSFITDENISKYMPKNIPIETITTLRNDDPAYYYANNKIGLFAEILNIPDSFNSDRSGFNLCFCGSYTIKKSKLFDTYWVCTITSLNAYRLTFRENSGGKFKIQGASYGEILYMHSDSEPTDQAVFAEYSSASTSVRLKWVDLKNIN